MQSCLKCFYFSRIDVRSTDKKNKKFDKASDYGIYIDNMTRSLIKMNTFSACAPKVDTGKSINFEG